MVVTAQISRIIDFIQNLVCYHSGQGTPLINLGHLIFHFQSLWGLFTMREHNLIQLHGTVQNGADLFGDEHLP